MSLFDPTNIDIVDTRLQVRLLSYGTVEASILFLVQYTYIGKDVLSRIYALVSRVCHVLCPQLFSLNSYALNVFLSLASQMKI